MPNAPHATLVMNYHLPEHALRVQLLKEIPTVVLSTTASALNALKAQSSAYLVTASSSTQVVLLLMKIMDLAPHAIPVMQLTVNSVSKLTSPMAETHSVNNSFRALMSVLNAAQDISSMDLDYVKKSILSATTTIKSLVIVKIAIPDSRSQESTVSKLTDQSLTRTVKNGMDLSVRNALSVLSLNQMELVLLLMPFAVLSTLSMEAALAAMTLLSSVAPPV